MKSIDKIEPYAVIYYDGDEKLYTISSTGKGGAIVSGKTLPEAAKKFNEAMMIVYAVEFLINFGR